jgi:uncharacterized protein YgiM (DUF1202 family)
MKLIALITAAAVTLCAAPLAAREVPFDAIVSSESLLVRSGPGDKEYYPTQKLDHGARVRVIREGYGGWYMIEPPQGSHSWIRAEFVDQRDANKGLIRKDTVDRIGSVLNRSNLSIIHKVYEGEVVTILGKATMRSGQKPVEMLKIAPPRGEYRYINRRDVVPSDEYGSQPSLLGSSRADRPASNKQNATTTGPFGEAISPGLPATGRTLPAGPTGTALNAFDKQLSESNESRRGAESSSPGFQDLNRLPDSAGQGISMPGVRFETPQPLSSTPPSAEDQVAVEQAWQNVMQTDAQFRQMLQRPVSQWDLASLKQVYGQSAAQMKSPSLKRQIENRMAAVDRYQKLYADQIAIERILAQTEFRDEEIRQSYLTQWHSVSTTNPPTTRILKPTAPRPRPVGQQSGPAAISGSSIAPIPSPTPEVPNTAAAGSTAKITGAGIVQRSALSRPGLPAYVLLAPDGRVLSYLQPGQGINLDAYIGQSVGITGARSFRRELNADLMIVRGVTPVNLQP